MMKFKKPQETTFTKYMKIGAVLVAVLVIIFEVRSCRQQPQPIVSEEIEEQQVREVLTPEETFARERAFYASKRYLEEVLKNADSLSFPSYGEEVRVTSENSKIYFVEAWVDELDSTDINIRHTYKAEIEKLEGRNWKYRSLMIDGEKVR